MIILTVFFFIETKKNINSTQASCAHGRGSNHCVDSLPPRIQVAPYVGTGGMPSIPLIGWGRHLMPCKDSIWFYYPCFEGSVVETGCYGSASIKSIK